MTTSDYTSRIPYGYCHCGCGQKTTIALKNHTRTHAVKGEPTKYIKNHVNRISKNEQIALFWSRVSITADDNLCWLWTEKHDKDGYGKTWWNGKTERSHRVAWMYPDYSIPNEMFILHSCDNPICCNPKHLFIGTALDNNRDRERKGRGNQLKGEQHHMHKLTEDQVRDIRRRYFMSNVSYSQLAHEYGVTPSNICMIVKNKTWQFDELDNGLIVQLPDAKDLNVATP